MNNEDDDFLLSPTPKYCRTCRKRAVFVRVDNISDSDMDEYAFRKYDTGMWEDEADNVICSAYSSTETDDDGNLIGAKPDEVLWEGKRCPHYKKADDKPLSLLVGLAVGDALGVPVEFKPRGSFMVSGMQGGGSHNQPPGTWSDDTSLALAMADCLYENGIGMDGIADNFIAWRDEGAFTPHGIAFDVGCTTEHAIERLKKKVDPKMAGGTGIRDNGNGSLMRIAPLTFYLFGMEDVAQRFRIVKDISSITHGHEISVAACFIYIEMLNRLREGASKEEAYSDLCRFFQQDFPFLGKECKDLYRRILEGDIRSLPEEEIRSGGFVVETLEASLWSFLTTDNYRDAVLRAVNLGGDTDTTGAVTGAMAGLAYGLANIPLKWRKQLAAYETIEEIAISMPRWDYFRVKWKGRSKRK